jgi:hypothetical protein
MGGQTENRTHESNTRPMVYTFKSDLLPFLYTPFMAASPVLKKRPRFSHVIGQSFRSSYTPVGRNVEEPIFTLDPTDTLQIPSDPSRVVVAIHNIHLVVDLLITNQSHT